MLTGKLEHSRQEAVPSNMWKGDLAGHAFMPLSIIFASQGRGGMILTATTQELANQVHCSVWPPFVFFTRLVAFDGGDVPVLNNWVDPHSSVA